MPLIGNVASVIGNNSFEINGTVNANSSIAYHSFNNRSTIYIYGEIHTFSSTTITAVNNNRVKVFTFVAGEIFFIGVFRTSSNLITIEVPSVGRRSDIGGGKCSGARSSDHTLQRNCIVVGIAKELRSELIQFNGNVDVFDNIDSIRHSCIATCAVLDKANRVNHITCVGYHRIIANRIGNASVHDNTILVPCVGAIIVFRAIDCCSESDMTTVTDSVTGVNCFNSQGRFCNHFHRINADSFTIDACLLNQHTVFLIITSVNSRNMSACCGSSARDSSSSISITVPIVKNTCCQLITDISGQCYACTGADRILIMSDLYIDCIIHIYIVGLTCHGAASSRVGHHESE